MKKIIFIMAMLAVLPASAKVKKTVAQQPAPQYCLWQHRRNRRIRRKIMYRL